ncbi:hypothetical protein SCMU_00210 [Sinomonas cyclohexanicum]|uniref:HTH cro/C1-type domain-containing protein n=1 Tax=Sinomonas cyclohexanicum TaxID=322009 RepID=A0ABN6FBU4_SINCY|nr:helix-turn-helix transcriptional regulator [Corynebacterium cyclohexanicum]BCT74179.1 hypothetical protein SCMU_00210 [Corynebacterium cyclohexanicum]
MERTPAKLLAELRILSGMTVDQLGRLMGVSRRSVHNWLNGGAMSAAHAERLATLTDMVSKLPAETPLQRRAALLDSSGGQSLFHQWISTLPTDAQLQASAISARDRVSL